jgi:hypothetical protein
MTIRSICRSWPNFLIVFAVACGGNAPSASDASKPTNAERTAPDNDDDGDKQGPRSAAKEADGATTEPPAQSTSSEKQASIPEGLQLLDRRSLSLDFALNLAKKGEGKGVNSGTWSFAEERTMRVKSAQKDVITEMQVVYGKWEAKPLLGLTYQVPTDGKTYLLASKSGEVTLTRGANEKVSSDEQRAVKAEYGWVGEQNPVRKALLDAKLEAGAELPKSAEMSRLLLGAIPGVDGESVETTATLEKVEGAARKKAVLKVKAKLRLVSNKTAFDLELNGTANVDVLTGWVLGAELAGTANASGTLKHPKQGEMEVSGKSKVTLSRSSEFR